MDAVKLAIQIAAGILIAAFVLIGIGMGFTYASLKAAVPKLRPAVRHKLPKLRANAKPSWFLKKMSGAGNLSNGQGPRSTDNAK